jgi:hypothetical protein
LIIEFARGGSRRREEYYPPESMANSIEHQLALLAQGALKTGWSWRTFLWKSVGRYATTYPSKGSMDLIPLGRLITLNFVSLVIEAIFLYTPLVGHFPIWILVSLWIGYSLLDVVLGCLSLLFWLLFIFLWIRLTTTLATGSQGFRSSRRRGHLRLRMPQ